MPEPLKAEEVNSKTDPSVSKQWDTSTPRETQVSEFYKYADSMKVGLLTTMREGVGPVSRSMAIAKRNGPDFLFFANNHSDKFADLKHSSTAQLVFQNSSSQDWASLTGTATASNSDPRIKELFGKSAAIWYGDLGDGVHIATADDPRVSLIELKPTYITHWKSTVGSVGFMKEAAVAAATGEVAVTGLNRRFEDKDVEAMRNS